MDTKQYAWKMKHLSKGLSVEETIQELERIQSERGELTPQIILEEATPKDSLLHSYFTWDNKKAATAYRLHEARTLLNNIEIKVISNGGSREINVFEVVKTKHHRVYKHFETFTPEDIAYIRRKTAQELQTLKSKLALYKEFEEVVSKLDEALLELETENAPEVI